MKINIDQELEEAHKDYLKTKQGVIFDLITLKDALTIDKNTGSLDNESYHEYTTIIERTISFINKGEV